MHGDFQRDILAYIYTHPESFTFYKHHIRPGEFFADRFCDCFYTILYHAYDAYKRFPTRAEVERTIRIKFSTNAPLVSDVYCKEFLELCDRPSSETTLEQLFNYISQQKLITLSGDIQLAIEGGLHGKDDIEKLLNQVQKDVELLRITGSSTTSLGFDPFDANSIKNRGTLYDDLFGGVPRPTGFAYFDRYLRGGGLRPGDEVVIMATTGAGKTVLALNLALHFSYQGLRGAYILLDNQLAELVERVDAIVTGEDITELKDMNKFAKQIQTSMFKKGLRPGLFWMKPMEPYATSVGDIKAYLHLLKTVVGPVDYLIIDQGDHVNPGVKFKEVRHNLEHTYTELRGMAMAENLIVVATTQSNRAGLEVDTVLLQNSSEAYSKFFPASLGITLSQTPEELAAGKARATFIKNTRGEKNIVCPLLFQPRIMTMTDDPETQPYRYAPPARLQRRSQLTTTTVPSFDSNTQPYIPAQQRTAYRPYSALLRG